MKRLKRVFSEIYDQYIEKIYRFIFLKVGSEEVAEDLASETFLRVWEKFRDEKKNPIENPKAFLYQIAKNLVIDYYRKKGQVQTISAESDLIGDPRQDLEEKALLASDMDRVRLALAKLKQEHQNVIIWHYLDDLSISEVAKLLNKSEQATRVLIHRALKALRSELHTD